jgi:hypothetical protein
MSIPLARSTIAFTHTIVRSSIRKVWEDSTMSHAKQPSKRMHRACAVPLLGAAGLSLSLASGAPAATEGPAADMPTQNTGMSHEITLGEEEISDVSLATFYVFDKENPGTLGIQLARGGGCGGGGCGGHGGGCGGGGGCARAGVGGCGGGGCAGAGGCGGCSHGGCGGCSHGGCRGCHGGCGGGGCVGVWWGGCGGCGGCGGSCWIWTPLGWVWAC